MQPFDLSGAAPAPVGLGLVPPKETKPGENYVWSIVTSESDPFFLGGGQQSEDQAKPTSVNSKRATLYLPFFCFFDCWNSRWCCSGRLICCELHARRDRWLWFLHLIAFCIHLTCCILSLNAGSGDMSVEIVRISASWENTGGDYGFSVVAAKSQFIRIDVVTAMFFGLSAFMHGLWVFLGPWTFFLWRQIDACLVATRWIEYSLSASLMAMAIAITVGIREQNTLSGIFFLHFITMLCGLLTEIHSRPAKADGSYNMDKWEGDPPDDPVPPRERGDPLAPSDTAANASSMEVGAPVNSGAPTNAEKQRRYRRLRWNNYVWRMTPHVAGFFPFIAAWVVIVNAFFESIDDLCQNLKDRIPVFVVPVIFGSVGVFSCFTVVQIVFQWRPPKEYWKTEVYYTILSATAKIYLGGLLFVNVLSKASFNEAVAVEGAAAFTFNYTEACLPPSPPMAPPPALPASG